jgi:hypothetical protein
MLYKNLLKLFYSAYIRIIWHTRREQNLQRWNE